MDFRKIGFTKKSYRIKPMSLNTEDKILFIYLYLFI